MTYRHLTSGGRHELSALRKQGFTQAAMAGALGRSPSTISREISRNIRQAGCYRPSDAIRMICARRSRSWRTGVSERRTDSWSAPSSTIAGAQNRSPTGSETLVSCGSAVRPSTVTSGLTRRWAAPSIRTRIHKLSATAGPTPWRAGVEMSWGRPELPVSTKK